MVRKKSRPKKRQRTNSGGPITKRIRKEIEERKKVCFNRLRRCIRDFKKIRRDTTTFIIRPQATTKFASKLFSGAKSLATEAVEATKDTDVPAPKAPDRQTVDRFIKRTPQELRPAADPGRTPGLDALTEAQNESVRRTLADQRRALSTVTRGQSVAEALLSGLSNLGRILGITQRGDQLLLGA